jgi:hypothetical protein
VIPPSSSIPAHCFAPHAKRISWLFDCPGLSALAAPSPLRTVKLTPALNVGSIRWRSKGRALFSATKGRCVPCSYFGRRGRTRAFGGIFFEYGPHACKKGFHRSPQGPSWWGLSLIQIVSWPEGSILSCRLCVLCPSLFVFQPSAPSFERTMLPIKPPFLPGNAKRTSKEAFC